MNIHTGVREAFATDINALPLLPAAWSATTDTYPEWTDPIVQIGHPQNIRYANSCKTPMFELTVTLWINESDHTSNTAEFYTVLMDVVWPYFEQHAMSRPPSGIGFIGGREQGPVGWLSADIELTIQT